MNAPTTVTPGLRFRSILGDEKVLFEVDEELGRGYFECVALNEPTVIHGERMDGDYAGHRKAFSTKEILGALRLDEIFGGYDPANYEPQTREIP